MMVRQNTNQARLFYEFDLEDRVPSNHLLRRINAFVAVALADLHAELASFFSHTGRPSIDPELMALADLPFADTLTRMKRAHKNLLIKTIGIIVIFIVLGWVWNYRILEMLR